MAARIKTWMWVVAGIAVLGILCLVAVAGVSIYFFSRHIDTRTVSSADASSEFAAVKSRFTEKKPLIELDRRGRFVRSNQERPSNGGRRPETLYVLAFDPADERIVRVTVPFWLLRLKLGGATVDFNGGRMDLEDLKLSVEDLERLGPALIVDHATPNGERVLVWSQ